MLKRLQMAFIGAVAALLAGHSAFANTSLGRVAPEADSVGVPLNSTVMLMGDWDWHKERGRCRAIVDEALSSKNYNETLNFLPTHFHIPDPTASNPDILNFCHSRYFKDGQAVCPMLDKKAVQEFKEGLTDCFQYALKKGREVNGKPLSIAIVPHIDDGGTSGRWRNTIAFDPYPRQDMDCDQDPSRSYYCALLKPVAEALAASLDQDSAVYFALQGEMGATVFAYPDSYRLMSKELKRIIQSGPNVKDPKKVEVGLSLNFNRVSGELFRFDQSKVKQLFDSKVIDFIGLSSYGEISFKPYPTEFENTINTFAGELDYFGISLQQLMDEGVELHFSEFGPGGGNINGQKSGSAWSAASSPWGGVHGPFATATNPWSQSDLKAFQEDFYCAGLHYLEGGFGRKWKISHAFIWNLTSWDVQAVYPFSISADGSYRNETIATWIREYNKTGQAPCSASEPLPLLSADHGLSIANFEDESIDAVSLKRLFLQDPKAIGIVGIKRAPHMGSQQSAALELSYWLGTGRWDAKAGIMQKADRDWSGARGIGLWMHGDESTKTRSLRFGLRERSGEYWEMEVAIPQHGAGFVELPFAAFKVPPTVDNQIGDRQLDLDSLVEFDLIIAGSEASSATEKLWLDDLLLLQP